MPDEELTLILRLRDEATKQMKSARAGIVAAGAAIAAAGFAAGAKWDTATKTIVDGTGATGDALKGLQSDYQAVAKYGDNAATVIADLNTHLGLEGEELQRVAAAALKAGVDSNLFGDVSAQLGLDAKGAAEFLDDLTVASQGTGVDIDTLTRTIGKSSARWQAAGGDMDDLAATVIAAADEFGPSGLRGAMSEIMQEVDKGLLPTVASLETQLGDTTGAVERTYKASKTWRDTITETKNAALAYIGPAGDMLGVLGSTASGLALAGPQMVKWIGATKLANIAQKAFNFVMNLNPIGLIITAIGLAGLAIYTWRDQIWGFLKGAWNGLIAGLETGYNFIARLVPGMKEVSFASQMSFEPAVEAAAEATADLAVDAEAASAALAGGGNSVISAMAETAVEAAALAEKLEQIELDKRLAVVAHLQARKEDQRQFIHDAIIARNKAKVEALKIEQEETTAIAEQLENRRLEKRQFIHDAIIERNKAKAEAVRIAEEEGRETGSALRAGLSETFSAENVGATIARAFEAGEGLMSALKSIGAQMATNLASSLSSALSSIPIVGPFLGQFGGLLVAGMVKLGGKLWGAVKGLFGGPSGEEREARSMFAAFHEGITPELKKTEAYTSEVQSAISAGWDRTLAETAVAFKQTAAAAGLSADEGFAVYERYQHAVGAGNTELMAQIEADYAGWQEKAGMTTETMTEDFDAFFKGVTAEQAPAMTTAMIEMFAKAQSAANAYIAVLHSIPTDITTTITTHHVSTGGGSSDVFRPSQIDPNRAGGSQPAIQVTAIVPRDAVTATGRMLQNGSRP